MSYDDSWGHGLEIQRRRHEDRQVFTETLWDLVGVVALVALVALLGALWTGSP